jgi:hypothetical protein
MSFSSVQQAIAAIQAGNVDEGARLLKLALRDPALQGTDRAITCVWLAEITADPQEKLRLYDQAVLADPNNQEVRQKRQAFVTSRFMPPSTNTATSTSTQAIVPPSTVPMNPVPPPPSTVPGLTPSYNPPVPPQATTPFPPVNPGQMLPVAPMRPASSIGMYQTAAVIGGPNGTGTAFFIQREGLLATTRYTIGGVSQLTIDLRTGQAMPGYVVRAYPEYDLAFIYVQINSNDLPPFSPMPSVPAEAPLTVLSYRGETIRCIRRNTKRVLLSHWFPTTLQVRQLPDTGGGPILDERNQLVGMITRNTSSTSDYVYGLHIHLIRTLADQFRQESGQGRRAYCHCCGYYSQALFAGAYYCERCGGLHPQAENITRYENPQMRPWYTIQNSTACPYCGAVVGFHKDACLRCGRNLPRS